MDGLRITALFSQSTAVWSFVGIAIAWVVAAPAADKKPNPKGNDQAEIQAAQKKLEAAKEKEAQARKSLQEAIQRAQEAQKQVLSAREKVEQASDSAEVRGLRNRIAELTREQNRLMQPLLAALEEDPAQQSLLAERDAARVELADQEEPVFKAAAAAKLAEIAGRIAARERAALAQEPRVAAVRTELETVGEKLNQLTAGSRGLEKDAAYLAAKVRFGEAKERVESAELGLARARQAVSAAQRKVQQEVAEERAEDRREQQQKQKKKNDGKKK